MKNLILVIALLGSSLFTAAQERTNEGAQYLRQVQTPLTPKAVVDYQIMAVEYDVAQSDLFDGRDAPFLVVFRTQKGWIEASYDWKGEVVEAIERFRNIALPNRIIRSGMESYSGWRVIGTNYYVYYVKDRRKRIIYSLLVSDGKKRKKILLDVQGRILN